MAAYCHVPIECVAKFNAAKKATIEAMQKFEIDWDQYQHGLGPRPTGVLIDCEKSTARRRMWKGNHDH